MIQVAEVHERIDKLISKRYPEYSRSNIQKWIENKWITVNEKPVKPNYKCQLNDQISGNIPAEEPIVLHPENIPLTIIYEDDSLLIVNKPRGMIVHPTKSQEKGTLVNALLHYTDQLSTLAGSERPGIVHRLDKDTSGLLIVAKNNVVHESLSNQFKEQRVERVYQAIVHDVIGHEHGKIDAPIGRDRTNRLRMAVVDHGKEAITHFKVLKTYAKYTLVECQLETGRTHQIRVHMNYIGHPLVGDQKYGKPDNVHGQALFAKQVGFLHPEQNKWMTFEIEQPSYFKKLLHMMEKGA